MVHLQISDDALDDLTEGYWFYESQEAGLGDYFTSCLRADIQGLTISAGIHRKIYGDFHRCLRRVFPFAVFYTLNENSAIVWAVIDCRKEPASIRDRLDS
jgi:hypothetical protein